MSVRRQAVQKHRLYGFSTDLTRGSAVGSQQFSCDHKPPLRYYVKGCTLYLRAPPVIATAVDTAAANTVEGAASHAAKLLLLARLLVFLDTLAIPSSPREQLRLTFFAIIAFKEK